MARPTPASPFPPDRMSLFQDLLAALHTLPADIYVAPAPAKLERETLVDETIRVGTAAEGATIKEGSYLVVKDRLAQIIDGCAGRRSDPQRQGLGRHTGEACAHHPGPRSDSRRRSCRPARPGSRSPLGRGAGPAARILRAFQAGVRPDQPDDDQRDRQDQTARSARPSAGRTFSPSSTIPTSGSSPRSRTTTSRPASPGRARSSPSGCSIRP